MSEGMLCYMRKNQHSADIDAYIAGYPPNVQKLLQQMRTTIAKAAPMAEEAMAYGLPTFRLNGNLVHFGAFAKHIGFFPAPSGITNFAVKLKPYKTSKGTIQFPLDGPIPWDLVTEITKFRVVENIALRKASKKRTP